ncbi:MAG: cytochrome P460 family protein [Gemmatimonadota bacterium]
MNRQKTCMGLSTAACTLLALACGTSETPDDTASMEMGEEAVTETAESALNGIDTTAEAVWEHLQDVAYTSNWDLWPETDPYYEGQEPHGMLLTTYVNDAALEGIQPMMSGDADEMPLGAVIVKENYQPDSTLASVTVMYKARQYDAEHGNWFWMKRAADGSVPASGHVGSCIDCHEDGPDYLMGRMKDARTEM